MSTELNPVEGENMWHNQSSSIEAQQSNQPVLQITVQEVIDMIDSTAHEETRGDDVRREETMSDMRRREETMSDMRRREETKWNSGLIRQFRILIRYKRSCSSPELRP